MNMKRLLLSTTNTIENGKVLKYYGVVSSHIVAGAGFFSDLAASISDFLGGRSGAYRGQLERLYEAALDDISDKAHALGANAILGLSINMDNIAGKNMSMFMITAIGTAVKIDYDSLQQDSETSYPTSSYAQMNQMAPINEDSLVAEITQLLEEGAGLNAILKYKKVTGCSLQEAKDFVDELKKRLDQ